MSHRSAEQCSTSIGSAVSSALSTRRGRCISCANTAMRDLYPPPARHLVWRSISAQIDSALQMPASMQSSLPASSIFLPLLYLLLHIIWQKLHPAHPVPSRLATTLTSIHRKSVHPTPIPAHLLSSGRQCIVSHTQHVRLCQSPNLPDSCCGGHACGQYTSTIRGGGPARQGENGYQVCVYIDGRREAGQVAGNKDRTTRSTCFQPHQMGIA